MILCLSPFDLFASPDSTPIVSIKHKSLFLISDHHWTKHERLCGRCRPQTGRSSLESEQEAGSYQTAQRRRISHRKRGQKTDVRGRKTRKYFSLYEFLKN